jgi:Regulator of ribonuclease activity B
MPWFRGGHVQTVERIDDSAEADERVLAHLAELGCDERTPCRSTHFVYLPQRAGADAVAAALGDDGWVTTLESCDDGWWLVAATHRSALTSTVVRSTRRRLEALAGEHGGLYDGWEATAS